jgi:IS30 family transposase
MVVALSLEEREQIALGRAGGETDAVIARRLGRHRSTIGREVRRNTPFAGFGVPYRGVVAHREAVARRPRPKPARLAVAGPVRALVVAGLRRRWSPRQIEGWLRREFPDQPEMWVSHETIYRAIYLQSRGNQRAELARQQALRSGRVHRRPAAAAGAAVRSRRPWLGLNVSARPAEADDRAVPGHWEGDLLVGARGSSAIATVVERASRFVLLVGLTDGRTSEHVISELTDAMRRLPAQLRRSLTWDQGSEMAEHARFTLATDCPVYFCDPHSPWQRGSNENTNGLLRQYFPKGKADFRTITQDDLDAVAAELNTRPRQTLGWQNPAQRLAELLVATTS